MISWPKSKAYVNTAKAAKARKGRQRPFEGFEGIEGLEGAKRPRNREMWRNGGNRISVVFDPFGLFKWQLHRPRIRLISLEILEVLECEVRPTRRQMPAVQLVVYEIFSVSSDNNQN